MQYLSAQWWEPSGGVKPHTIIASTLDGLRGTVEKRRKRAAEDAALMGYDLSAFGIRSSSGDDDVPRFNAAENVIDTIVSMTVKERVLPMAITEGGTTEDQERAKEFNRIMLGILEEGGAYELDYLVTDDSLTSDAGVIVVVERNGRVEFERAFSFEFAADPSEGRYGLKRLRTLYRTHAIDREVLREQFRDPETGRVPDRINRLIDKAKVSDFDRKTYGVERSSDMLVVHEAWHLRAGPKAKDGRYAMCLPEGTLTFDEYESDRFPAVFFYYKEPKVGIWQKSVLSKLAGAQRTFDKTNQKIEDAHDLLGVPRILIGKEGGVLVAHLDDEVGAVLKVDDINQTKEWNAQPIHPDVYAHRNQIPEDMLRFFGVSGMSAQSSVPAGLSNASGRALDVFNDSESDRLSTFWKSRQKSWVLLAKVALEVARAIGKKNEGYLVAVEDGKELRVAKLEDFDIASSEKRYRLTVQPTSFLAKKPSAKYRQLSEMRERGDISPREFRQHLDLPDVVAVNELETAPENLVDRRISEIFKTGRSWVVEPFHPHRVIFDHGIKAYDLAQLRGEPEDRLALLRDLIQTAWEWLPESGPKRGKAWELAPPGAPGVPPQPPPGPPMPGPEGLPGMPPAMPAAPLPGMAA